MNPIPMRGHEKSDEYVIAALKALAANDRALEARPEIGARLRVEFQARRVWRMRRIAAWWTAAAAAILVALLWTRQNPSHMAPASARTEPLSKQAELKSMTASSSGNSAAVESRGGRAKSVSNVRHRVVSAVVAQEAMDGSMPPLANTHDPNAEVVTEFFPLMSPALPFDRGELLRVNLPASAMQMIGLPVREDRLAQPVQADVLIGEEGMPRAIRFVKADFR